MPTLNEIFDKRKIFLYQNESLDLDHYYQEPYQDENDEIKEMSKPFETDESKKIRTFDLLDRDRTYSGFGYFMDGSRRTYKIGDMVLEGKKIFPVVVAQIRAGCTERNQQKKLHTHGSIKKKNLYTTRGCPNHCSFCAVPILEPHFHVTNNIIEQIRTIDEKYGPKQHLLLLDNNVLNTADLKSLVDDLCTAGFGKGAKYVDPGAYNIVMMRYRNGDRGDFLDKKMNIYLEKFKKRIKSPEMLEVFLQIVIGAEDAEDYAQYMLDHDKDLSPIIEKYRNKSKKARYLDFNQGVDGRKINDENMEQLARLAIRPLRIAFDDIKLKDAYCRAVRTAHRHGIKEISNYILFNYKDKPEDLYERLRINIELNKELGIKIFSFPMKYSPITETDRAYIGKNWYKKYIRAISAILQVTKGVVAAGSDFFYKAFGNDLKEYFELLAMPREMIMFRSHFEENGITKKWKDLYGKLNDEQKDRLMTLVSLNVSELKKESWPDDLKDILEFYLIKYSGKKKNSDEEYIQLSLMDIADVGIENKKIM